MVFEFHGHNLKAIIKSISILQLADEQRGSGRGGQQAASRQNVGILMEKKKNGRGFFKPSSIDDTSKGSAECNPGSQFQI